MQENDKLQVQEMLKGATTRRTSVRISGRHAVREMVIQLSQRGHHAVYVEFEKTGWQMTLLDVEGNVLNTYSGDSTGAGPAALLIAGKEIENMMRKPPADSSASRSNLEPDACPLSRRWPALAEHLTSKQWDDGTPRVTSTVTLSSDAGRYMATVRDRALAQVGFYSATTLTELLDMLDAMLAGETFDFRPDKFARKK